jgi:hypothetical protein
LAFDDLMKVTSYMASRWVKAAFLAILGIIILFYVDGLVEDLKTNLEAHFEVTFQETWSLLTWLLWILVAWLFVDAVLTVALSVTEQKHSPAEIIRRLQRIEKKLGVVEPVEPPKKTVEDVIEEMAEETSEEEVPPPPKE